MRKKEYHNGDLTIVWEPGKCSHAGVCVRSLPKVYDPKAKPWITAEKASVEELKSQINQCPSGALSYYMKNEENKETPVEKQATNVNVIPNGPLRVLGPLSVTDKDGNVHVKENGASFCRCGASANKPFCDGEHRKIEWKC